jgi:hypothetical protein
MPDISMCSNKKCKQRKTCYRFTARPSIPWQSYGSFEPNQKGVCDNHWRNNENKKS